MIELNDIDFENKTIKRRELDIAGSTPEFAEFMMPITGHFLDAIFANEETLEKRKFEPKIIEIFKPPDYTAGEYRVLYGIFKIYAKRGFTLTTFTDGIFTTHHELCEAMEYKKDKNGKFGKWEKDDALKNLSSLAKKLIDIYKKEFIGLNKEKKKMFDIWVLQDEKILQFAYKSERVKEGEEPIKKTKQLWIKLLPVLFNKEYFKLAVSNFYSEMRSILEEKGKRVTDYHWDFMFWLLKQNNQKLEINIDKLVKLLKVPNENKHLSRARKIVRELYPVFKKIGYLLDYEVDVETKSGGKKEVLLINPDKFLSLKKRLEKQKEKSIGYSSN